MSINPVELECLQEQIIRLVERLHLYMLAADAQSQQLTNLLKKIDTQAGTFNINVSHTLQSEAPPDAGNDTIPVSSRLGNLIKQLQLSPFERDALILSLMPQFDSNYGLLFSKVQNSYQAAWPTVDLMLKLLAWGEVIQSYQHLLEPDSKLLNYGLLNPVNSDENQWGKVMLKIDPEVYYYLLGHDNDTFEIHPHSQRLAIPVTSNTLPDVTQLLLGFCTPKKQGLLVALKERQTGTCLFVLPYLAQEQGARVLLADLSQLPVDRVQQRRELIWILREASLHNDIIVFTGFKTFTDMHPELLSWLARHLENHTFPVFYLSPPDDPMINFEGLSQQVVSLPKLSFNQEIAALQSLLSVYSIAPEVNPEVLVRRFHPAPDKIQQTLQAADFCRQQRGGQQLTNADLFHVFRQYSRQPFGKLAKRIEPVREFSDLIIGEDLQEQLDEVLAAIKQREYALQQGFERKIAYGTGISVLFHGDSGTGKTMVAEVLAKSLGVDLIKVDISTVVNKYIGETEKNLAHIFDHAQQDAGVLFFDEADALFGKRSETKDAHDRHANIEVSYLLQRFEEYPGLVILATNNRNYLDEAFTRRLTFIIRFPFPDVILREKMWRNIWPEALTLAEDINFTELAGKAEITGANIKNIALLAAWLAAEEGSSGIKNTHIQRALGRELKKLGRVNLR
ncbi:ATP-binding protein [Enterobacteriaceae bacterium LUAb1]